MPFLLRLALEGLRHVDMPNCKQIIVIPDGAESDLALQTIVSEQRDGRVRCVALRGIDKLLVNLVRSDGRASYRHFIQIVQGLLAATTDTIYLHDADAFWLEKGGVESQYREFRERGMYTLGVQSRMDPMFREGGLSIPGTWELMFSSSWVRQRPPADVKCGWYRLPNREWRSFDTLLFGQYLDCASGRIGVMASPPKFVHFYGTIIEYRSWQRSSRAHSTEDRWFSLLLLSILSEVVPGLRCGAALPRPQDLVLGLRDPTAPITYLDQSTAQRYATFRRGIEALCLGPVFASTVSGRIRDLVSPFDKHFGYC
jgi:hypothetical protein